VAFDPRPYTIVKSIAQRGLLKWWSDPQRKGRLPTRADCQAEQLHALWPDIALYEVRRENDQLRYKCLSHGARLRPIDGADLSGLYLDEFFPDSIKQTALAAYDATVTMACPIYTQRDAVDSEQVPVTFERIRVPLSEDGACVDHLLTTSRSSARTAGIGARTCCAQVFGCANTRCRRRSRWRRSGFLPARRSSTRKGASAKITLGLSCSRRLSDVYS
jgi:hypothetical protein